jgi:hypothetical protein
MRRAFCVLAVLCALGGAVPSAERGIVEDLSIRGFAKSLVLPHISFKDAGLEEALEFLRWKVGDVAPEKHPEMNIIFKPSASVKKRSVTLEVRNLRLDKLVEMVAREAGYEVRWDGWAVVLEARVSRHPSLNLEKASIETTRKLALLVLHNVRLNDRSLREILKFLDAESQRIDPEKVGVRFVLKLPADDDGPRITMRFGHILLLEAASYAAELSGYNFVMNGDKVEFFPKGKETQ